MGSVFVLKKSKAQRIIVKHMLGKWHSQHAALHNCGKVQNDDEH